MRKRGGSKRLIEPVTVLRWIHEFAGIAWYGEVFFMTFILMPVLGKLPPDSKGPLMVRTFPRIFNVATVSSSVTIVAGILVALLYSNFDLGIFMGSTWGLSILLGGLMGLFMYILHVTVEVIELGALRQVDSDEARAFPVELKVLERRVNRLPRVGFVILTITLVMMIYASHGV